ncbi:hypothetical protein TI04_12275, partial [Achromatium sp. WMS2]
MLNSKTKLANTLVCYGVYSIKAILTLIFILLSGCSAPTDTASLRMGLASAPVNLDPRYATDAASSRINELLYQSLVIFNAAYRPIPGLATWTQPTPTSYLFKLRFPPEQRKFANGQVLTTEDIRATLASILDPSTGSPYRSQLTVITNIKVLDSE